MFHVQVLAHSPSQHRHLNEPPKNSRFVLLFESAFLYFDVLNFLLCESGFRFCLQLCVRLVLCKSKMRKKTERKKKKKKKKKQENKENEESEFVSLRRCQAVEDRAARRPSAGAENSSCREDDRRDRAARQRSVQDQQGQGHRHWSGTQKRRRQSERFVLFVLFCFVLLLMKRGGKKIVAMTIQVGDTVLLSESYNGTELSFEGKDYSVYREDDILAVLKD
jgi:hypothetical protein